MDNFSSYKVGKKYFIQTITNYFTGELVSETITDLVLVKAAWVSLTGYYADFLKNGMADGCEIEPCPPKLRKIINKSNIIDADEWPHALPRKIVGR